MTAPSRKRDSGASLVSALLLVAVMASLAMALAGDLRFSMRRSANMDVRDQAYWYALGAREFSESIIERAMQEPERALRPDADWLSGPRAFPIDRGQLAGRIRDGNNCFNLNGLVTPAGTGEWQVDTIQLQRFETLMRAVGIPSGSAARIAAQAADWIDSDTRPIASGGEDGLYRGYRTANTLIAEREELLALEAMTPAIYARLQSLVCTRPVAGPLPLNINTLTAEQWPLLAAAFDGELTRVAIDGILIGRPADGFANADAFWALEPVRELDPDGMRRETVGVTTRYFEIEIDVAHAGQVFVLDAVIEYVGGDLRRLTQSYGSVA
jgi:general secretion pathway protein K